MMIGENIRRIRLQRGLTQAKLGNLIGISESAIRMYELGNRTPKIETLQEIAGSLGVDFEELFNDDSANISAMHRLFQLFRQYEGTFDQNGHLYFKKIDLQSWYNRWKLYIAEIKEAEKIPDETARRYAIRNAEDKFNWWMDTYSESDKC